MTNLINDLISVLEEESEIYKLLIAASKGKKAAIIANDLSAIKEATQCEFECVGKIRRLEKKRADIMKDMAEVLNEKESNITISLLADNIKGPESEKLRRTASNLKQSLGELAHINDVNSALINRALEYIDFSVNVARSSMGGAIYALDGSACPDTGGL